MTSENGNLESDGLSYSAEDLEHICQALLLHVLLKLPLLEKGDRFLRLAWKSAAFKARVEQTLRRLSSDDEFGMQRMSEEDAKLVEGLLVPQHAQV